MMELKNPDASESDSELSRGAKQQCMNKQLLISEQMPKSETMTKGIKQNEWEWLNAITLTKPTSSAFQEGFPASRVLQR